MALKYRARSSDETKNMYTILVVKPLGNQSLGENG
jgi:hypothetical protein